MAWTGAIIGENKLESLFGCGCQDEERIYGWIDRGIETNRPLSFHSHRKCLHRSSRVPRASLEFNQLIKSSRDTHLPVYPFTFRVYKSHCDAINYLWCHVASRQRFWYSLLRYTEIRWLKRDERTQNWNLLLSTKVRWLWWCWFALTDRQSPKGCTYTTWISD